MANPTMFKVIFTIICVKQESMSQAFINKLEKIYFWESCLMHRWNIVVTAIYILYMYIEYIKSIAQTCTIYYLCLQKASD